MQLNEYLSSIQIDEDDPGFLLSWELNNLNAFLAVANAQNPARAPVWLRTLPPNMTPDSFTDDVVHALLQVAGGHCGRVLMAPNTVPEAINVGVALAGLQNDDFMQDVAQIALPVVNNVERHLAITYSVTETRTQRSVLNNLAPSRRNNSHPGQRLFI